MSASLLSGAVFGAALVAAGVSQPAIITSQLKFENFHMLRVFLTAGASSSLLISLLGTRGLVPLTPRGPSNAGLFSRYDGNILGGALLGIGMALSGACPGTVLSQVASGVASGLYTVVGAVLGAIAYTRYVKPALDARAARAGLPPSSPSCSSPSSPSASASASASAAADPPATLDVLLGVPRTAAVLGLVAAFSAIIAASMLLPPTDPRAQRQALAGGLLITAAQLLSVTSRGAFLAASTAYEEAARYADWAAAGARGKPPGRDHLVFSAGLVAGALAAAASRVPHVVAVAGAPDGVAPLSALLGGFVMILGSRIAGGCTSGHGISGISLLSVSSFITIAATFGAGGLVAPFVA